MTASDLMQEEATQNAYHAVCGTAPGKPSARQTVFLSAAVRSGAPHGSQFTNLADGQRQLQDHMGDAIYDRDGSESQSVGLSLEVLLWQAHVFSLTTGS